MSSRSLNRSTAQVYRLMTTLLDPFGAPAKEVAVLFHERCAHWGDSHVSAPFVADLALAGVVQEIYALLLAHTVVPTLMLRAASQDGTAPTALSFTATIRILDDNLIRLGLVSPARRSRMVAHLLREIAAVPLPQQRVRIQARVVKRRHSRYGRKKPEHWHAPLFELDLDFSQILVVVV